MAFSAEEHLIRRKIARAFSAQQASPHAQGGERQRKVAIDNSEAVRRVEWTFDAPRSVVPGQDLRHALGALAGELPQERRQALLEHRGGEAVEAAARTAAHGAPKAGIRHDGVEGGRDVLGIAGLEQQATGADRPRNAGRCVGHHRHSRCHRLDQRHTEAFVLTERKIDISDLVVGRKVRVGYLAGQRDDLVELELLHLALYLRKVAPARAGPYQLQPRAGLVAAVIHIEAVHDVGLPLVICDAPHEQDVHGVLQGH